MTPRPGRERGRLGRHPGRLGRNFRLVWVGYTLSAFGDAVVPAALTLAVIRATGSASALALVLACATIPRLVLLPLGGVFADRWPPRRVAIVADLVRGLAQFVIGVELVAGVFRLSDLAVAAVVSGAASAFALPTGPPLVAATVAAPDRPRANGLIGVARGVSGVLGPAAGGALVLTVGPGWAFLADAATFAVSAVALAAIRTGRLRTASAATGVRGTALHRDLATGWAEVRRHDWLWTSLVLHGIWNFAYAVLATLGPVIVVRRAGGEAVWVAVLQAGAIGVLAGSVLATRVGVAGRLGLRISRPVLLANVLLATVAAPLALFAVDAPAPALVAAYALALAGVGFLNPVWESVVQQHVASERLARVASWDMLLSFGAMPLGYALAAPAAGVWGEATTLWLAATLVGATVAAAAFAPGVRALRLSDERRGPLLTDSVEEGAPPNIRKNSEAAGGDLGPGVAASEVDGRVQHGQSVGAGEHRVQ